MDPLTYLEQKTRKDKVTSILFGVATALLIITSFLLILVFIDVATR